MPGLVLKEYQRESLDVIAQFCDGVRSFITTGAMRPVHDAFFAQTRHDYIDVPQFSGVPYCCLRVPTGGGKTLIGSHSVGVIAKRLGHQDRPLCLWVTPSTTIRDQTLRGLRNREHPYHAALRDSLGGVPVEVLTIEEALAANRSMLSSSAVIIVTTIQSYRIDDEGNRRVYQDNGYLMDHFTNLPAWVQQQLEHENGDRVALSLANVMKLRGPIIIMDEAHNARTRISFDSLARFGPLAVLELTATPLQDHDPERGEYASNVLHAVSALQLKREGMIKLPVELESRESWLDVLATTIRRRESLQALAQSWGRQSGRTIRPIALVQAQPHSRTRETHTAEATKQALTERFNIPVDRVRIVTGTTDELGEEDLRHPDCLVEYVVTVEKLREGWDCPFAYVLGSIGNVATETAVEQLLGRILRMPEAIPTGVPELDRAYAVVQSQDIIQTASSLRDSLVSRCGFDPNSVADAFRIHRHMEAQTRLPIATIPVSSPIDAGQLPAAVRNRVVYDAGSQTLHVQRPLTRDETIELRDSLPTLIDRAAVETYWQEQRIVGSAAKPLDAYAEPLRIPRMVVRDAGRFFLFEPEELDEFDWNLDRCDPCLSETEFSVDLTIGKHVNVDLTDRGGVQIGGVEQVIVRQLTFLDEGDDWAKPQLVGWLDRELHRGGAFAGLTAAHSQSWLLRVVDGLLTNRTADLPILVRKRHDLADVVIRRIAAHGRAQVREAANMLIAGRSSRRLETSMDMAFELAEQDYAPYDRYDGEFGYRTHAFDQIGAMKPEESQCAKRIDDHPNTKRWIRNLEHESAGGFSLPLSPGRFFPDFIVELQDGRIVLVEYKGPHLAQDPRELHKKTVGELWAARSAGRGVFVRVVDHDWPALEAALA